MINDIEFSLILPIHNQESFIADAVAPLDKALKALEIPYEIILVENGSLDKTLNILKRISRNKKELKVIISSKGYGSAVIAGLKAANGRFVCYMPSDGQLSPILLPRLYILAKTGKYDVVKIFRTTRESLLRLVRSRVFNILVQLFYPLPKNLTDINGSPRVFERKLLPVLSLSYKDSFIDTEFAVKAFYLGLTVKEIPAETLPRLGGKSTVSYKTVVEFINNLLFFKHSRNFKMWKKK